MKSLREHQRGQINSGKVVALIVGLTVFALLASFLLPVAIGEMENDTTQTLNQTTNTVYDVNGELNSTVTATTAGTSATIELQTDAQTISKTINVGDNATYAFNRGDVTVGVEEAQSGYAIANYSYAPDFAYSDAAQSLWTVIPLVIVLAAFLFAIGAALSATNRI